MAGLMFAQEFDEEARESEGGVCGFAAGVGEVSDGMISPVNESGTVYQVKLVRHGRYSLVGRGYG